MIPSYLSPCAICCAISSTHHRRAEPSSEVDRSTRVLGKGEGEKATAVTALVCPDRTAMGEKSRRDHTRTMLSFEPLAMYLFSGSMLMSVMSPCMPVAP